MGDEKILVDPSLPDQILQARLAERSSLNLADITLVFLTSFEPLRRRALLSFSNAKWFISEIERETVGLTLIEHLQQADEDGDEELVNILKTEVAILERCKAAPDSLAKGVDLFPLYGVTPGTCGLLLPTSRATILICGDAIASEEHLEQGKVLPNSNDIEMAQASFQEAIEIADLIVTGRGNVVVNPLRQPF